MLTEKFYSPQLLMVLGIGPEATLKKHNISVVSDLPGVGQNMHDSTNVGGITFPVSVSSSSEVKSNSTLLDKANEEFIRSQSGILTNEGGDYIVILLLTTISRGNVTIDSPSMHSKPVISVDWLLEKTDQEIAVQAYRRGREIWSHTANVTTGAESKPGANVTSDEAILEHIQSQGISAIHHGTSTCMMGKKNNTMAVVDSHGRVFVVDELRVIDSSSFAFTPPGHTGRYLRINSGNEDSFPVATSWYWDSLVQFPWDEEPSDIFFSKS
ncbi:hypothetical protein VTL71DRAFT_13285 [Oculimacula yallundae]|uniref:Glucose-methanol-choline oxidoreductase C-terminal domain-containing protein n=1 Tax=Oculimacula yallundae TaxID=86028 RepID=A0ABR4CKH2_9HELO